MQLLSPSPQPTVHNSGQFKGTQKQKQDVFVLWDEGKAITSTLWYGGTELARL
jgi:hypothetical protein